MCWICVDVPILFGFLLRDHESHVDGIGLGKPWFFNRRKSGCSLTRLRAQLVQLKKDRSHTVLWDLLELLVTLPSLQAPRGYNFNVQSNQAVVTGSFHCLWGSGIEDSCHERFLYLVDHSICMYLAGQSSNQKFIHCGRTAAGWCNRQLPSRVQTHDLKKGLKRLQLGDYYLSTLSSFLPI